MLNLYTTLACPTIVGGFVFGATIRGSNTFTVGRDVTKLQVDMCGGCGGMTNSATVSYSITSGSKGACFSTVIDVTGLETLTVNVGGNGANAYDTTDGERVVSGGSNGGGVFN